MWELGRVREEERKGFRPFISSRVHRVPFRVLSPLLKQPLVAPCSVKFCLFTPLICSLCQAFERE